jgi:hypothetical protein
MHACRGDIGGEVGKLLLVDVAARVRVGQFDFGQRNMEYLFRLRYRLCSQGLILSTAERLVN